MLIRRRALIRRLLSDDPDVRARSAGRHLVPGDRLAWRRLMAARGLSARERTRIQRALLDLIDDSSAGQIVDRLDRYHRSWRPFIATLARTHAGVLKPRLQAMLRERQPARVTIGVVGLSAMASRDAEAGQMVRNLIIRGARVDDRLPVEEAVAALGRLPDDASIRLLSQLCRSPDGWRRRSAARALAGSRSPGAIRALLASAADDPDLITAPVAARLARRVDVARMMSARDSDLSRVALVIFRACVAGLGETLDLSLLPRLRLVAQTRALLARYMERPLARVVEAVLDVDEALTRRWWPAYRMQRPRPSPAASPETPDATASPEPAPSNDDVGAALTDIQALLDRVRPLDRQHVVRALIDGLDDPEEAYVLTSIACLGRLRSELAVEALVGILPNSWGRLRHAVIRALGQIRFKSAVGPLIDALRARLDERSLMSFEHTAEERQEIAELFRALCRIHHGVPLWVFRSALAESDEATRRAAADGLDRRVELRDRDAADLLIATIQRDRSPGVRAAAVASLGHASVAEAADILVGALDDRNLTVRRAGVRSLGRMRSLIAADPIRRAMREPELKHEAALALGRILRGDLPPRVLQTLVEIANNPADARSAVEATDVLGHLDIYEAQIALEHLAKDPAAHPTVREAAERARWNRAHSE